MIIYAKTCTEHSLRNIYWKGRGPQIVQVYKSEHAIRNMRIKVFLILTYYVASLGVLQAHLIDIVPLLVSQFNCWARERSFLYICRTGAAFNLINTHPGHTNVIKRKAGEMFGVSRPDLTPSLSCLSFHTSFQLYYSNSRATQGLEW